MNSNPLVSVAMATYNGADYLKEQLIQYSRTNLFQPGNRHHG